ncbi:MAG: class F420-dependent oxidoreductase [Actinomycetota bacterium]|jgi:alkanesulfonate monooxygenase SsuD/methylene tetrahydromethanopterin reductase-like flavin-dependent oxidoreductase (luciferase family)
MEGFDIVPTVPVIIGDDIEACAEPVRAYCALYIGGMGSREKNFYNALAVRMGFGDAAAQIQDLYLAKDYAGAAAAVPLEFIQRTALIGPPDAIVERLKAYAAAGVTTLSIASYYDTLESRMETVRLMPELLAQAGLAEA